MTLEIIGAGFGRTGTMAMKLALETLGFGPCYHMMEVSQHEGHAEAWLEATERGKADWDSLFAEFRACVDWPACNFYQSLLKHYPRAKVILSVRDPDAWYDSVLNTIYARLTALDEENLPVRSAMAKKLILEQTFSGRFAEREHAIGVFNAHTETVRATVPAEKLLIYETGSGWEPLCTFLSCPQPSTDYPHVNTREDFRARHLSQDQS